jgi:rare lipoprotein A
MERVHPSCDVAAKRPGQGRRAGSHLSLASSASDRTSSQTLSARHRAALAALLVPALLGAACSANRRAPAPPGGPGGVVERGMASWYGAKFNGRRTASGERYDMRRLTAAHPNLPFGTMVQVTNLGNGRQVVVRINDRGPFSKRPRRRVIDLSYAAARDLGIVGPGTARVELALAPTAPAVPPGDDGPFETRIASLEPPGPPDQPDPPGSPGSVIETPLGGEPRAPASSGEGKPETPGAASQAPELAPEPAPQAPPAAATPPPRRARHPLPPTPTGAAHSVAGLRYTVQVGAFGEPDRADALQRDLARLYPAAAVRSDGTWSRVQIGLFANPDEAESLRHELLALGLTAVTVAAR